jgi:NAD-dependent deacetylase
MDEVSAAARQLAGRERILVFTGAGISTESGIPDFRGPNGLWKTVDPAEFTIQHYVGDPDFRRRAWERRFGSTLLRDAVPNDAHRAVARLWQSGRVTGVVTQNIDGLHGRAGIPAAAVAELHGNAFGLVCYGCGDRPHPEAVEERWRAGEADPSCERCGGILKSTTVMFGEDLPEDDFERASQWASTADAAIAVGTTLSVYPAALIPLEVAQRGEPFVIVNEGRTDHDNWATARLEGRAGSLLPPLVDSVLDGSLQP